jgi:hypothetical protein
VDLWCSYGARQFWSRLILDSRARPDDGPPVQIMVPAGYAGYRRSRPSFRGWQRAVAGAKRSSWVRSRRGGRSSACVGARTPGPTLVTASSTPASWQLHEPARRPARSIEPAADAHATLAFPAASATATRLWRPLVTRSLRRHTELVEALDRLDIDVAELHASLLTYATGEPARPCTSCACTPRGLTREGRQELSSGQVPGGTEVHQGTGRRPASHPSRGGGRGLCTCRQRSTFITYLRSRSTP